MSTPTAPEACTEKHLRFLDRLRESGKTNMFGARPYLMAAYKDLSDKQALEILSYWMESYWTRHPSEEA